MSKGHTNYKHKKSHNKKTKQKNTSIMENIPHLLFEISNHKNIKIYTDFFTKLYEEGNPLANAIYKTGTHIKQTQNFSTCCDPFALFFSLYEGETLTFSKEVKNKNDKLKTKTELEKTAANFFIDCCPNHNYAKVLKNNLAATYQ